MNYAVDPKPEEQRIVFEAAVRLFASGKDSSVIYNNAEERAREAVKIAKLMFDESKKAVE